jgi:hypothetical protein
MPGTFTSCFLLAFDLDDLGQPVPAFEPRPVSDPLDGQREAEALSARHGGVVLWRRQGAPAIGEEGESEVLFSAGRIGDFD